MCECRLNEGIACKLELALLQIAQTVVVPTHHSLFRNRPDNWHSTRLGIRLANEVTTAGNVLFHAETVEVEETLAEEVVCRVEQGIGEIAEEMVGEGVIAIAIDSLQVHETHEMLFTRVLHSNEFQ